MVKVQRLFAKTNLKIQVCRIKKIGIFEEIDKSGKPINYLDGMTFTWICGRQLENIMFKMTQRQHINIMKVDFEFIRTRKLPQVLMSGTIQNLSERQWPIKLRERNMISGIYMILQEI